MLKDKVSTLASMLEGNIHKIRDLEERLTSLEKYLGITFQYPPEQARKHIKVCNVCGHLPGPYCGIVTAYTTMCSCPCHHTSLKKKGKGEKYAS